MTSANVKMMHIDVNLHQIFKDIRGMDDRALFDFMANLIVQSGSDVSFDEHEKLLGMIASTWCSWRFRDVVIDEEVDPDMRS